MRGVTAPRIGKGVRRADRRSVGRAGDCFLKSVVRRTPEAVTGAVDRPAVRAADAFFFRFRGAVPLRTDIDIFSKIKFKVKYFFYATRTDDRGSAAVLLPGGRGFFLSNPYRRTTTHRHRFYLRLFFFL
jgi:hypothetical protein